jgi:hypothetical protein
MAEPYSGGRYRVNDMFRDCCSGLQHLWVVLDGEDVVAAATTRFTEYPTGRMLSAQFCGGSRLSEWIDDIDKAFSSFADQNNCMLGVEFTGRHGWEKVLPDKWRKEFVVYRRGLDLPNEEDVER